jgi:hypothetical protein
MRFFALSTLVFVALAQPFSPAQAPPALPDARVAPSPGLRRFDNSSLQVRQVDGRWQLWAANLMLKDFGPAEREANEALQVFRDLRVTAHGSVGSTFEYWLVDGQAPMAITRRRQVIPFDPTKLHVERVSGQCVLKDAHVVLYNFGQAQSDAEQALAICKQFGFDQLGYVGHPTPILKYLLKDPNPRPPASPGNGMLAASAMLPPSELVPQRLVLPGNVEVGDRIPFDGRQLDLRRESGEWVLYCGHAPVGRFGFAERDARAALQVLQEFRVTELCRVGENGFGFFLANGRAPTGTTIGFGARPIRTDVLNVRQVGGAWAVCEGEHPLFAFGDRHDEADHVLAAIRAFHFDQFAAVGNGHLGHVYLLIKSR